MGSARALLRLADHAAPHQSVQTWCIISRHVMHHACASRITPCDGPCDAHTRCAWDGAKLRPCLSVAARQLGPAELKVVKGEPGVKAKAGLHTAAAATADADVEVTGSRSREQRDAEGFRNAQVLQGGDDDDGDDDEAASPLRPGGDGRAVLKRSRKK